MRSIVRAFFCSAEAAAADQRQQWAPPVSHHPRVLGRGMSVILLLLVGLLLLQRADHWSCQRDQKEPVF